MTRCLPAAFLAAILSGLLPGFAAGASDPSRIAIYLPLGRGEIIDQPDGVTRVSASNPDTVDAVVASDKEVLLHAMKTGTGTVVIWSRNGSRKTYDVTVEPDLEPLRRMLRQSFPDDDIDLRASRESLALVGRARTQAIADRALALVTATVKGAVSNLEVAVPPSEKQILLRVRFAELNRTAVTEFGVNLLSTGALRMPGSLTTGQFPTGKAGDLTGTVPASSSGTSTFTLSDVLNVFAFRPDLNLGVLIRDMASRGLLQILAEPNLVATNGKEATFLAGGEFPVPIAQSGANAGSVTVQFREFGIRLSFTPQITPFRTVRLHVKPEVSSMDPANGVTISGFRIPALSTRRIETDVELAEGQSFVIAGMLNGRVVEELTRVPGLADIPLLGALFRSRARSKANTELVVVVTPEMAAPLDTVPPLIEMPVPFMGPVEGERKDP